MSPKESKSEEEAPKSSAQLQSEMRATRERLVENITQLKEEVSPEALKAKATAKAQAVFMDPETGSVRVERVAAVAGTVVALIVLRQGLRARAKRRHLEYLKSVVWVPVPRLAVSPDVAKVARDSAELCPGPAVAAITAETLTSGDVPVMVTAGA